MNVLLLREAPPPALAGALAEFEARFVYPLGPGRSFRISHGEDYPRFFRAMGGAACFVAEQDGRVLGALGVALRTLLTPDGGRLRAAYVGDLKVAPDARGSRAFLRLAQAAFAWARPHADAAWGVVMDGTRAAPTTYTGRLGIPGFLRSANVLVLRFPVGGEAGGDDGRWLAPGTRGPECFRALTRGRYAPDGGNPAERSESPPLWLAHPDGSACGRLEDTRRAKRLFEINGSGGGDAEMLAAHLGCFAWSSPADAAELIHAARRQATARGLSALFVAVAGRDLASLDAALGGVEKVIAPATVYAAALTPGPDWVINSSEI